MPLWPSNFAQFGGPHVRPLGTSGWNISFDVHWGQLVHSWHCVQEFWRKTRFFNEIGHFRHFYHFCLNEGCDTPTLKIRDSHRTTSGVNLRVPLPYTNPITSFGSWHPILLWPGALSDTGQCNMNSSTSIGSSMTIAREKDTEIERERERERESESESLSIFVSERVRGKRRY